MPHRPAALVLVFTLGLAGCADALRSQPPEARKWTVAFWYWHGNSSRPAAAKVTPDALYFKAGTISSYQDQGGKMHWWVYADLPNHLPPAREYWMVFRDEQAVLPDIAAAPEIGKVSSLILIALQPSSHNMPNF